jgi:ribosomal 50S subunit-associated protein YjgA (DUF615 family)
MGDWQFNETAYNLLMEKINGLQSTIEKQNSRIGRLEEWRNRLIGAWAALVALIGYLFSGKS